MVNSHTAKDIGGTMKEYSDPTIVTLGTVVGLTEDDKPDKCGGSGDAFAEVQDILRNEYEPNC
jgi:hypothetical protein